MRHRDPSVAEESDRAQAAYFLEELQRQAGQLDEDAARLRALLTRYQQRNLRFQVARLERQLRRVARQRREILDMAAALGTRFKPEHS